MKKLGVFSLVLVGMVAILILAACAKQEPPATPTTPTTPTTPVTKASPASIANGGQIYDKWWKVVQGAAEPKDNQAQWALQTTNTRKGPDTWRCKECHGWDYKGKDGAYGKGSHLTGFPGVYNASTTKTKAQLLDVLKGKTNANHNFATLLGEAGLNDLATFLKEGVIDETKNIDYSTKKPIGANVTRGKELYSANCASCHGVDGKQILFDGKDSLGFLANDNPWEVLHKIRFGQPGAGMPSGTVLGWSVQDAVDVLGHAQTLPK